MEAMASKALAWCGAHWEIVSTILGLLAYAWLNAKNARTAVEKRGGSWLVRMIDAASVATMAGAKNKASAPILGKSIVDAARAEVERQMSEPRETIAPEPAAPDVSGPRKSEPGFIDERVLLGIVAVLVLPALALTGCPMPAPDGCSPGSRRCHEDTPQVCSPGQRWTPADVTCSTVRATCVVRDGIPACLRGEQ